MSLGKEYKCKKTDLSCVVVPDFPGGILEEIESRKIRPSKNPLRDQPRPSAELLLSVAQMGLVQPIVVRPIEQSNHYEVVAGNRRLNACKMVGLKKIPCSIIELDDREAYETSIVENLQRKTLNPIEEAKAFSRYVVEFGYGSETQLARKLAKSTTYVSRRIALLKLPKRVQEGLLRGAKVSLTQELLSLDEDDRKALSSLIAGNDLTTREDVRRVARFVKNGDLLNQTQSNINSTYAEGEARQHSLVRVIGKYIASLEVCLIRLDDVLGTLDKGEWVINDILTQNRMSIHRQIDDLMRLRKKIQRKLPPIGKESRSHTATHRKTPMLISY